MSDWTVPTQVRRVPLDHDEHPAQWRELWRTCSVADAAQIVAQVVWWRDNDDAVAREAWRLYMTEVPPL